MRGHRVLWVLGVPLACVLAGVLTCLSGAWVAQDAFMWVHMDRYPTEAELSQYRAWTALGGNWQEQNGEIRNNNDERGARLMNKLGVWRNYALDADLSIVNLYGEAGFVLRSSEDEEGVDAYNGYFAGVRAMDHTVEFGRVNYGWHTLLRATLPLGVDLQQWFHMRVVAAGCHFLLSMRFADGQIAHYAVNDAHCIGTGGFGIRSYQTGAAWKNLRMGPATERELRAGSAEDAVSTVPALLTEPDDAYGRGYFHAALLQEARRHTLQPGVATIDSFLWKPGRHPNATIQGVMISLPPLAGIQDESNAIIVPGMDPATPVKVGDVVEAHGTIISERFRNRLEDAHLKVLWSETPLPPWEVTAAQLTNGAYRGRYISVVGTLISATQSATGYQLVLKDGDQVFNAVGANDFQLDPTRLEPGSRLRVRGNSTSLDQFTHRIYPFTVIAEYVEVMSAPPWWSLTHVMWVLFGLVLVFAVTHVLISRVREWHMQSILHEREQLAFEMHDTLAQSFTGIAYQLEAASMERRGVDQIRQHVKNALHMVSSSHREASRTIASLRPQYRDAGNIADALGELAERVSDGSVRVEIQVEGRNEGRLSRLPLTITDALYRIGQEAVTNSLQHANCEMLRIHLQIMRKQVLLSIQDDGCGIDPERIHAGLGMDGMRSRAAKIRARLEIASAVAEGTTVRVRVPLPSTLGILHEPGALMRAVFGAQGKISRDPGAGRNARGAAPTETGAGRRDPSDSR